MRDRIKITIIGNSVALRTRPPKERKENLCYGQLLESVSILEKRIEVTTLAKSRNLVTEAYFDLDRAIATKPDVYIINLGCVDAPPREIPLWFSNWLFKRNTVRKYEIALLFYLLIKNLGLRKILTQMRFRKPWVSKYKFEKYLEKVIFELKKDTSAIIILMGINKGNQRLENQLPGIISRYNDYNSIIEKVAQKNNTIFLSVSDLISSEHYPDGVHYNNAGHQIIANRIVNILKNKPI